MVNAITSANKAPTNWAGNQSCDPQAIESPGSPEEVAAIVTRAALRNQRVKAIGAGHSFTGAAMTDGTLLSLERISGLQKLDSETGLVTVGAGMILSDLNLLLDDVGLALPNLGDIAVQSVAGATATATHGTGTSIGNLATQIVSMEIVTGTGQVLLLDADNRPDLLRFARVGVGALGIVTSVTLQAVPAFNLHVLEQVEDLRDVTSDVDSFLTESDHSEFFWFPGTTSCLTKRNNRTTEAPNPPSKIKYFIDKILAENVAFDLINRTARRFPSTTERLRGVTVKAASSRELTDKSFRVFASPRHVKFVEMEYGIPRAALSEVIGRIQSGLKHMERVPLFPIEVRASAADDIPLSTGYRRNSAWVAVHQYKGMEYEPYFRMVETIMNDYEGRPHWGKMHFQTAETLAHRYPEWEGFAKVRNELDPERVFANEYLDRVFD